MTLQDVEYREVVDAGRRLFDEISGSDPSVRAKNVHADAERRAIWRAVFLYGLQHGTDLWCSMRTDADGSPDVAAWQKHSEECLTKCRRAADMAISGRCWPKGHDQFPPDDEPVVP